MVGGGQQHRRHRRMISLAEVGMGMGIPGCPAPQPKKRQKRQTSKGRGRSAGPNEGLTLDDLPAKGLLWAPQGQQQPQRRRKRRLKTAFPQESPAPARPLGSEMGGGVGFGGQLPFTALAWRKMAPMRLHGGGAGPGSPEPIHHPPAPPTNPGVMRSTMMTATATSPQCRSSPTPQAGGGGEAGGARPPRASPSKVFDRLHRSVGVYRGCSTTERRTRPVQPPGPVYSFLPQEEGKAKPKPDADAGEQSPVMGGRPRPARLDRPPSAAHKARISHAPVLEFGQAAQPLPSTPPKGVEGWGIDHVLAWLSAHRPKLTQDWQGVLRDNYIVGRVLVEMESWEDWISVGVTKKRDAKYLGRSVADLKEQFAEPESPRQVAGVCTPTASDSSSSISVPTAPTEPSSGAGGTASSQAESVTVFHDQGRSRPHINGPGCSCLRCGRPRRNARNRPPLPPSRAKSQVSSEGGSLQGATSTATEKEETESGSESSEEEEEEGEEEEGAEEEEGEDSSDGEEEEAGDESSSDDQPSRPSRRPSRDDTGTQSGSVA